MRIAAAVSAISLAIISSSTPSALAFVGPSASRVVHPTTLLRDVESSDNAEEATVVAESSEPAVAAAAASPPPLATTSSSRPSRSVSISQDRLDKVISERPYPLFLAEKAASFLIDPFTSPTPQPPSPFSSQKPKEHLVVLGTGWGAASFLKNIDTDKYDVTVISPRNYFVFTPMLAGASVGSVDFKSITEPIREVCYCICVCIYLYVKRAYLVYILQVSLIYMDSKSYLL